MQEAPCLNMWQEQVKAPLTLLRTPGSLWAQKSPPAFQKDLRGAVHGKDMPDRSGTMWNLEQNISYCSGGQSKRTDRFNPRQDPLRYGVYVWEIKDKPKR